MSQKKPQLKRRRNNELRPALCCLLALLCLWRGPSGAAASNNAIYVNWFKLERMGYQQMKALHLAAAQRYLLAALRVAEPLGDTSPLVISTLLDLVETYMYSSATVEKAQSVLNRVEAAEKQLSPKYSGLAQVYWLRAVICRNTSNFKTAVYWLIQAQQCDPSLSANCSVSQCEIYSNLAAEQVMLGESTAANATADDFMRFARRLPLKRRVQWLLSFDGLIGIHATYLSMFPKKVRPFEDVQSIRLNILAEAQRLDFGGDPQTKFTGLLELGKVLRTLGQFSESEATLTSALKLCSGNPEQTSKLEKRFAQPKLETDT